MLDNAKKVLVLTDLFQISDWQHTLPWMPFKEGVDIYRLASNCGTSVAMIEKYYSHARTEDFASELTKVRRKAS